MPIDSLYHIPVTFRKTGKINNPAVIKSNVRRKDNRADIFPFDKTKILKKCISETNLPIFLYVFKNNKRAVALYQKLGFQVTEIIKSSRYIMQRN